MFPTSDHYWLLNAHVPAPLLAEPDLADAVDELALVHLEINQGVITQIMPASQSAAIEDFAPELPSLDLRRGLVWCCCVDLHTHLDKGHIWRRTANPVGNFDTALTQTQADRDRYWQSQDVYRRMEFGLKCSYAHGTQAIRTHIDSFGAQAEISLEVFKSLRQAWADRLTLQAASLVSLDYFLTPAGERLADQIAEVGGVLGGLPQMGDSLEQQLDRVFELAQERQLNLDFHTDESGDPSEITLQHVAEAALRHQFTGQIVCGHCCSLAVQSSAQVLKTLELLKQAEIGIVSLPMCNLYLQDRNQQASQHFAQAILGDRLAHLEQFKTQTPRWRGVTLVHELKQSGIPVAFASDNCRDPFHAYGDHDGWEVFTQSVRIAQLDAPYSNWCESVTTIPANLMGLPTAGRIGVGLPADLILFKARYFSELLSRSQHDRIVLRRGQPIDTTLPDYAELDDLLHR
jgi:cytosine deaminase